MADPAAGVNPLQEQLRALRRGAWIVVLTTAIVALGALVYSVNQTRTYQASAEVYLETLEQPSPLSEGQGGDNPERVLASQAELARFPAIAREAVTAAEADGVSPAELLNRSTVTPNPESDLLTFTVTGTDPNETRTLATGYARGYTNYRRGVSSAALLQARDRIGDRLGDLRLQGRQGSPLYRSLLVDLEELRTSQVIQDSSALLVRPASVVSQIRPQVPRNAVLGVVLGLILGVALALLRAALDTRVRSAEEVEERLSFPLLGRLREPPRDLRRHDRLAMIDEPGGPAAEPFQILATNLTFTNLERGARTIVVTSAMPEEGKSTTVANLAVALARSGRHVALVDLDLRQPRLARLFDLQDPPGVTTVTVGGVSAAQALVSVPLEDRSVERGLDEAGSSDHRDRAAKARRGDAFSAAVRAGRLEVLPAGPVPPNPAELLRSPAIGDVLAELEARADLVLIDAAPLLGVSDAVSLSTMVDAFMVVTRLNTLRRRPLKELGRVLADMPVTKLGFVVTGADADEISGYGYGHDTPSRGRRLVAAFGGRRARAKADDRVEAA